MKRTSQLRTYVREQMRTNETMQRKLRTRRVAKARQLARDMRLRGLREDAVRREVDAFERGLVAYQNEASYQRQLGEKARR